MPKPELAHGLAGIYKSKAEDFRVQEILPFEPTGEGEHVYLYVRKSGHNTLDVQQSIARLASVPRHHVGYAGLKDRQAVTEQWFSVYLPGSDEPHWSALEADGLSILQCSRHRKKLRTGVHRANRFELIIRQVQGNKSLLDSGLQRIATSGFPNYFGEQRFGRGGSNLRTSQNLGPMRKGRLSNKQAMALSAARSFVFNRVLAMREEVGLWDKVVAGDLVNLDGSNSFFGPVDDDQALEPRLVQMEVHPTGPMVGMEAGATEGEAKALEDAVLLAHPEYLELAQRYQARTVRRALRARVHDLQWRWLDNDAVQLTFSLGRGCYATSLLKALGEFTLESSQFMDSKATELQVTENE